MKHWHISPDFYPRSQELRDYFEKQFEAPQQAHSQRFVWDYWSVPDQYRLIRTPAYHYFPEDAYQSLESFLIEWGQKHLGCHSISPPWLSYYVDGCYQNIHADNPHGPWAFVYSLSPSDIEYSGGETKIMTPQTLDYWNTTNFEQGLEADQIFEKIPATHNQLTVFDPRLPHGVEKVAGVEDPRKARLVIHGWFTEPSPYFTEDISEPQAVSALETLLNPALDKVEALADFTGIITFKISRATLQEKSLKPLTNTLICLSEPQAHLKQEKIQRAEDILGQSLIDFPLAALGNEGEITLPLVFQ